MAEGVSLYHDGKACHLGLIENDRPKKNPDLVLLYIDTNERQYNSQVKISEKILRLPAL